MLQIQPVHIGVIIQPAAGFADIVEPIYCAHNHLHTALALGQIAGGKLHRPAAIGLHHSGAQHAPHDDFNPPAGFNGAPQRQAAIALGAAEQCVTALGNSAQIKLEIAHDRINPDLAADLARIARLIHRAGSDLGAGCICGDLGCAKGLLPIAKPVGLGGMGQIADADINRCKRVRGAADDHAIKMFVIVDNVIALDRLRIQRQTARLRIDAQHLIQGAHVACGIGCSQLQRISLAIAR